MGLFFVNILQVIFSFGLLTDLEERSVYYRETKNGLYTTLPFVLSNTVVNIPFLFACTLLFTLICYWAIVSCDCLNGKDCLLMICEGSTFRRNCILPLPRIPFPSNNGSRKPGLDNCFIAACFRSCSGDRRIVSNAHISLPPL